MKEGISYSFLLNIVILFIFVCSAIVMGILSYYRAFRANTIIVDTIEKYEGYNCLSAREAQQKLSGISYNVPFNVTCKAGYGSPCMIDSDKNYAVVSYNLDAPDNNSGLYMNSSSSNTENKKYSGMNSSIYKCKDDNNNDDNNNCDSTKSYQYGVYTFMYIDLPVVSNIIKIPFYSTTKVLHEFRDLRVTGNQAYDLNFIPDEWLYDNRSIDADYSYQYSRELTKFYADARVFGYSTASEYLYGPGSRTKYQVDYMVDKRLKVTNGYNFECGYTIDYSVY